LPAPISAVVSEATLVVVQAKLYPNISCSVGRYNCSDMEFVRLVVMLDKLVLGSLAGIKLGQGGFHGVRGYIVVASNIQLGMQVVTGNTEGREVDSHNHGGFHKERGARDSSTCSIEISLNMV
jgi:hypothetical protein